MVTVQKATVVENGKSYRSDMDMWVCIDSQAQILVSIDTNHAIHIGVHPDADESILKLVKKFTKQYDSTGRSLIDTVRELVEFLREKGL